MKMFPHLVLAMLLFFLVSCSGKLVASENDVSDSQVTFKGSANYYYDFDDILVPRDMELQPRSSFVVETPGVKAGVLVFKGRVDPVSLTSFFTNNMLKDGWQMSSSFRYQRAIMVFTKPDRDCIINIQDGRITTTMEIWIAPKGNVAAGPVRHERTLTQ
ncbi:hypothetical protein SAMN05660653_00789 [Desulfonatronum thiosulfatophilum]|uniref:Lipoprotein n=1 Tax=Desulfonatronum thiosulfatophilum TaxID=617002 RepID=A0A1G6B8C1_9BACT|nr:hypothetical protein [Desulfonatronum thiosulfatophilum]SDB16864.1 hypothetical protein SAMN05660653_00789 [Desulfonatronum thiosulfatophilum]